MEKTPDLAIEDVRVTNQMVMAQGLRRMVHFDPIGKTDAENEEAFALVIKELTGDWVSEIPCDLIQG